MGADVMARPRAEIGSVGLPMFAGRLGLDTNTRLRGVPGIRIYREMATDEPAAAAFLSACATLLRTDLAVVPGGKSRADAKAATFLESTLDDMRDSLAAQLRQMYGMIIYGYGIHELVYKRRSGGVNSRYTDGLVGWAAWAYRRQDTFDRWESAENGRPDAWWQRPAPDYRPRRIPLNKAIHLVADESDGSPEGKSALRGMYVPHFFSKNFRWMYGISLERFGTGVPVFEIAEDVKATLTEEQTDTLEAIAAGLRQNEEAFVITPAGIKFRFEPSPGLAASEYREALQFFSVWALSTVMAEFIALGSGETGSFALGKDKSELFLLALNGYQDRVVTALNRQAVPRLFRYNSFGNLTKLPEFTLPAVRRYDLASIGSFLQVLNSIGAFHVTPEDEAHLRRISDQVDIDQKQLKQMHAEDEEAVVSPNGKEPDGEGDQETGQDAGDMTDEEDMAAEGANNGRSTGG